MEPESDGSEYSAFSVEEGGDKSWKIFVVRAFKALLKESSRKRDNDLRTATSKALEEIKKGFGNSATNEDEIQMYLPPLKIALGKVKSHRIVEISIDCVEKLLSFDIIKDQQSLEELVEPVCDIIAHTSYETIKLQIIKCLLSAATVGGGIHGSILLKSLRTLLNIIVSSHDDINISTARTAVTQIVTNVFQKLERTQSFERLSRGNEKTKLAPLHPRTQVDLLHSISKQIVDDIVSRVVSDFNGIASNESKGSDELKGLPSPTLGMLPSRSSFMFSTSDLPAAGKRDSVDGMVTLEDAYYVFRAFCKLSSYHSPNSGGGPEGELPVDIQVKKVSLEIILRILETAGPVFLSSQKLISAIQQHLIDALLKNCVSQVTEIFGLSLSVFYVLNGQFKSQLKTEIGVFFSNIFFPILTSRNSNVQQKWMVLQMISKMCKSPKMMVDAFLNYDCDPLLHLSLFERIVSELSRVSQVPKHESHLTVHQAFAVKKLAIESLVDIIDSLLEWSEERMDNDDSSSMNSEATEGDGQPRNGNNVLFEAKTAGMALKQKLLFGISKFNIDYKTGLQYLVENKLVKDNPDEIAKFLHENNDLLSEAMIGQMFSKIKNKYYMDIMYSYIDSLGLRGLEFLPAFRKLLSGFLICGEAPVIDHIITKFADAYVTVNPTTFPSADTLYVIAFSTLLLNVDLHNEKVKDHMTETQFIANCQSTEEGKTVSEEMMKEIFNDIKNNQLTLNKDTGSTKMETNVKKKQMLYRKETKRMVTSSQELLERGSTTHCILNNSH